MKLDSYIYKHFDDLNPNDKSVISFILNNSKEVINMNINEVAKACLVSPSAVFRLTRKIGLSGFNQLKFILAEDQEFIESKSSTNFVKDTKNAIEYTVHQFETTKISNLYEKIDKAPNIYVYSTGWVQEIIANQLQRNFFLVGKNVYALPSAVSELAKVSHRLKENDLLIVVSYTGENSELINTVKEIAIRGISTIAFTPFNQNKLAGVCEFSLNYNTVECPMPDDHEGAEVFFTGVYVLNDLLVMGYSNYVINNRR
ncbi:MurR/RpiR family transcriptional regulator [Companilactobacillus zhachilii]|uniref:MurR/RpiR family transcriptional regulator n=1 Tax=Companilactobacillus zhachilii TaxID=2304606 RepID=UPI0019209C97|nr:MurR/RpiR family transcriptional regulator [Companilactobacillus zhachilii]MBL3530711.1 MurR/RpiR family transcriptional regulator [Companilactobacillus zhachilii]